MFLSFFGNREKDGDLGARGTETLSEAESRQLNWDITDEEFEKQWRGPVAVEINHRANNSDLLQKAAPTAKTDSDGRTGVGNNHETNVTISTGKRKAEEDAAKVERKLATRKL
jgi:hypothetical protein